MTAFLVTLFLAQQDPRAAMEASIAKQHQSIARQRVALAQ